MTLTHPCDLDLVGVVCVCVVSLVIESRLVDGIRICLTLLAITIPQAQIAAAVGGPVAA